MRMIAVTHDTHVSEARRAALARAHGLGFCEEDAGRVALVATEMATNLIKHAGGGEMLIGSFDDPGGAGMECIALDRGGGIANLGLSLRDGHSTAGTAGTGLGAIMRGSHVFDVDSRPGGTAVLARLMKGRPGRGEAPAPARFGVVSLPKAGEEACGDAWSTFAQPGLQVLLVADGLGHGPLAAQAAQAAVGVFAASATDAPEALLARMHLALRPTRGAAAAIARIEPAAGKVTFAGIGNVAGVLAEPTRLQRMVSHNGTVGHIARTIRPFTYPYAASPLVILASDGLGTGWSLERYPGLAQRHPALVAAVLYRDFTRGRDDVTVLVARGDAP
jgi:anti-sigma regulatory factor (Ser/Thr protein kinase)